jgi:hypothetical protein
VIEDRTLPLSVIRKSKGQKIAKDRDDLSGHLDLVDDTADIHPSQVLETSTKIDCILTVKYSTTNLKVEK